MDDLPELPFKQILSHLSLTDRIRSRGVSRSLRNKFDNYPVNSLCYSEHQRERIFRKRRSVSGVFAHNFIQSPRLDSFIDTFCQSMLSNLKHFRLCEIGFNEANRTTFAEALNSLKQLEALDIINFYDIFGYDLKIEFELNLPMLRSIHLEEISGIEKITLDAPSLQNIKIVVCDVRLRLVLVHTEPVERLLTDNPYRIPVMELKNLKFLYANTCPIESTFLSDLEQLKEIAIGDPDVIMELLEQKQRCGRTDLKVSLCGLLLDGPDDPAIVSRPVFNYPCEAIMDRYAEYPSKLVDEIPFYRYLHYTDIEYMEPETQAIILSRLTDLSSVYVYNLDEDFQQLLDLLKRFENIVELDVDGVQQELFDRLPEHSAVQKLTIHSTPSDFEFLLRLKDLTYLNLYCSLDVDTVRNVLEELAYLKQFDFKSSGKRLCVSINPPNRYWVYVDGARTGYFCDLDDVIQFLSPVMPLSPSEFREFHKQFQIGSGQ